MSTNKDNFNMADLGSALPDPPAALSAVDIKSKLKELNEEYPNVLEKLSRKARKRVYALREIQSQHNDLESKFFEERAALEAKYQKLYQPLYTKRYEIVNGIVEVEEVNETATGQEVDEAEEEKGIPEFWFTAMKTNELLAEEISGKDEEALKYLKDIKCCRIDNPKGFKLEFYFDINPYFKNSVLTKTYHMIVEAEPILERAIGTEIEWYPGKCLTKKLLEKRPTEESKNAKPVTKTESCESFFNFFDPPVVPEEGEHLAKDAAEELQEVMEQDYDIGATIRDKIVPHAVSWFTGEAVHNDFEDVDDDDDDDDYDEETDEDEEEEEEDDDDDKDEDESKTRKKSSAEHKV